ncbi:hypothetical protein NM688_g7449 [Phlebia brevispora]|uniref:Uncharacterized protein n=1 Tax=Phlebia brevispora TaxID=194682 RepID=A0ACC1S509_9APHY|nr:hypothetical protein NM688_g7449 [Phlebia brevispora]
MMHFKFPGALWKELAEWYVYPAEHATMPQIEIDTRGRVRFRPLSDEGSHLIISRAWRTVLKAYSRHQRFSAI